MARKNWLFVLMAALIAATLVAGCAAPPAQQAAKKKKVGFSVFDMQYGFFQEMEKGTREAAEKAGYDYVLVDQKSSESTMVSATQDLINQGIDALIISPFRPDAMGPLVDAAKKKGIPVVINDIGGGGTAYDVIVISNNAEGGAMAADQMDKLIKANGSPSKKVAVITNNPDAVYAWQRNVNFEKRIKELGYEVVASLNGSSQQEKGYSLAKDILAANPDVAGIFTANDPMGVGAAQAIADSGKSGVKDVVVIGFNADEIALKAIKDGTMAATIQQIPYDMGKMTVDLATKLMNGEKLKYDKEAEREIYVPVKLITSENVDTLLNK